MLDAEGKRGIPASAGSRDLFQAPAGIPSEEAPDLTRIFPAQHRFPPVRVDLSGSWDPQSSAGSSRSVPQFVPSLTSTCTGILQSWGSTIPGSIKSLGSHSSVIPQFSDPVIPGLLKSRIPLIQGSRNFWIPQFSGITIHRNSRIPGSHCSRHSGIPTAVEFHSSLIPRSCNSRTAELLKTPQLYNPAIPASHKSGIPLL